MDILNDDSSLDAYIVGLILVKSYIQTFSGRWHVVENETDMRVSGQGNVGRMNRNILHTIFGIPFDGYVNGLLILRLIVLRYVLG